MPAESEVVLTDFDNPLEVNKDYSFQSASVSNTIIPGSYSITLNADVLADSNYSGKVSVSYTIYNATRKINITGNSLDNITYDGALHTVTGYSFIEEIPEGETGTLINANDIIPKFEDCSVSADKIGEYKMGLNASNFAYVNTEKSPYIDIEFNKDWYKYKYDGTQNVDTNECWVRPYDMFNSLVDKEIQRAEKAAQKK